MRVAIKTIAFWLILPYISKALLLNSTQNVTSLQQTCRDAPFWKLNLCNITCLTCLAADSNKCASCDTGYVYSDNTCIIQTNPDNFYYTNLLSSNPLEITEVNKFKSAVTFNKYDTQNIVSICLNNTYHFQMLGLFSSSQTVSLSIAYNQVVSYFSVKLNILTTEIGTKFAAEYISDNAFKTVDKFYNLGITGTYSKSTEANQTSYLTIPSLNDANVRSIIQLFQIQFNVQTKSIEFRLNCQAKTPSDFWAISDVTVIAKQCNTCITSELANKLSSVGKVTLYTAIIIIPIICFFICFIKFNAYREEKQLNNKYTDTQNFHSTQIPIKGINRLIRHLTSGSDKQQLKRLQLLKTNSLLARMKSYKEKQVKRYD